MIESDQDFLEKRNWTIEQLESKRKIADPLADKVITEMMKDGNKTVFDELFKVMKKNSDTVPDHFPDYIKEYFSLHRELPHWANKQKIAIGQKFFLEYGSEISMMLFCKALPQCYACEKGVQVMYKTNHFVEKDGSFDVFTRRLMETAQFVFHVMSPDGFSSNGAGIIASQKVRLIHSFVRYYLKKGDWNTEKLGEPINQEDLTGTLMAFGPLVLEGLKKLNIKISKEEADGYMHCWEIAGYIQGVDQDLLPNNADEGLSLGLQIFNSQIAYSPEGEELIQTKQFRGLPTVLLGFY